MSFARTKSGNLKAAFLVLSFSFLLALLPVMPGPALAEGASEGLPGNVAMNEFAQILSDPVQKWQRVFGGPNNDFSHSVLQTSDGGYIMTGITASSGSGVVDETYLMKIDPSGNLLWKKPLGETERIAIYSIQQASDGGYIMAGSIYYSESGTTDAYLAKTDASFNHLQPWTYGGTGNEGLHYVQQTSDGGYIMAGVTSSSGSGGVDPDFNPYLIKADSSGNLLWQRIFDTDASYMVIPFSVQQTWDGEYLAVYVSLNGSHLVKIDAQGNISWQKDFLVSEMAQDLNRASVLGIPYPLTCVQQTADGGYILSGNSHLFPFTKYCLVKTDPTGNILWQKNYEEIKPYAYMPSMTSVRQTLDGGYVLLAHNDPMTNNPVLFKTDPQGNLSWYKTFGGTDYDYALCIQQTSDGGYIMAGYTESFGAGGFDAYLIKTDAYGNTGPPPGHGAISGRVTDIFGNPLGGATVNIYSAITGIPIKSTITSTDGSYIISLRPGTYKVRFSKGSDYEIQFYREKSSFGAAYSLNVSDGSITSDIDARLVPISEGSKRLKAALEAYKEAIMQKLDYTVMSAVGTWSIGSFALIKTGTDWASRVSNDLNLVRQLLSANFTTAEGLAKWIISLLLKFGPEHVSPAFTMFMIATKVPDVAGQHGQTQAYLDIWKNLGDTEFYRNYLKFSLPVNEATMFEVFPRRSTALGVESVKSNIYNLFSSVSIPAELPAGFPVETVVKNILDQAKKIRESAYRPTANVTWPYYDSGGDIRIGTESISQTILKDDEICAMSKAVGYGASSKLVFSISTLLIEGGATILGTLIGCYLGPGFGFFAGTSIFGAIEGIIRQQRTYEQTIKNEEALYQNMLTIENAVSTDVGAVWAIAHSTLDYIKETLSKKGGISTTRHAQNGSTQILGLDVLSGISSFAQISIARADAADIVLHKEEAMAEGKLNVILNNTSAEDKRVSLHCLAISKVMNEMQPVGAGSASEVTIPAGSQTQTEITLSLPRSFLSDIAGVELILWAYPLEDTSLTGIIGPALAHAHAGTEEELGIFSSQEWSILLEDDLAEGEVAQATLDLTSGFHQARLFLPEMNPYELYLEVTDSKGRRIAYDLESGEHTIEIPGARAELSSAYKFVELPGGDIYNVTVTGAQIEESSHLVLSCLLFPEVQGAISLSGNACIYGRPSEEVETGMVLRELSSCSVVGELNYILGDLEGEGNTIPASCLTIQGPSEISPGSEEVVTIKIALPEGIPEGTYAGTLAVEGKEFYGMSALSAQGRIEVIVDTTVPSAPVLESPVLEESCIRVNGSADPDTLVHLYHNGEEEALCIPDEQGRFSVLLLPRGMKNAFYAQAEDAARNLSEASVEVEILVPPQLKSTEPSSGKVGHEITLKGSCFGGEQGKSLVSFGSTQASEYFSWSETEIRCKVPPISSGEVQVTVTTEGGTSEGLTFKIEPFTVSTSVSGEGGSITPETQEVDFGKPATTIIAPSPGFHISSILDNEEAKEVTDPSGMAYVIQNVQKDHEVVVTFEKNTYPLTVNVAGQGSVQKDPDQATYEHGTVVNLTAIPEEGWEFSGWSGDVSGTEPTCQVEMNSEKTVTATFVRNTYTITASAGTGGAISPVGEVTVEHGSDQTFIITPDSGYKISDVKVDGVSVGAVSGYTFTNIVSDHLIEATFTSSSAPKISLIFPFFGKRDTKATVVIMGTGFRKGASVSLEMGTRKIAGVNTTSVMDFLIVCAFDLRGAYPGWYDVVVTNPDNQKGVRAKSFWVY